MFQACSPMGSQAIDGCAHPPGALGICAQVAGPLMGFGTQPGLQVWVPRLLIGVCPYLGALGLCAQAAWPLIWVLIDLGLRCVLGLLIQCSQSRG